MTEEPTESVPESRSGSAPAAQPRSGGDPQRFAGKTVLVTGTSEKGIGGAIAERMAREGARVALTSPVPPQRLLKRLERLGASHAWWPADVTSEPTVRQMVDECVARFGPLHVVVNNAGVEIARPFQQFTTAQWTELLDINLLGAIRVTQATLPHLASPGGVVVNIASALALGGCPSFSIYSASKAGLVGLTQSLAWELAPRRIRVVAVAPGLVLTPMIKRHIQHLTDDVWKQIERCHPLGAGLPHDVAAAVGFLASDDARWITGVTLPLGWASHYPLPVDQFMDS